MHPSDSTLNDYTDGALGPAEHLAVERHLDACGLCRQLVGDLNELRRRVASLPAGPPPARVWPRVAGAMRQEAARPGVVRRRWTWLAAAAVLVLCAAIGWRTRVWSGPAGGSGRSTVTEPGQDLSQTVESELLQAERHYQNAIAGLEQIANANQGALDPQTATAFQRSLSVIDRAIQESRDALKTEPDSQPAQQSLLDSFKAKVGVLQETVALINEMRKGNDAGVARIVSGMKKRP